MNVGTMLKCSGYSIIFTLVIATLAHIFSFCCNTLNLFMLASCLAYRVHILFKMQLGIEKHPKTMIFYNYKSSYNAELLTHIYTI